MNERVIWVYAKAIGIILVVYGHVARGLVAAEIKIDPVLYNLIDSVIYSFHMPLFFFLSGLFFIDSLKKRNAQDLLLNKIDTILYPYILWSMLQGTLELVLSSYTNGHVNYKEVFSFLWAPRAQFWFLYALFMIFVIAILIFQKTRTQNLIIPVFILSIFAYIFKIELTSVLNISYLTSNFVFFTFGIILGNSSMFISYTSNFQLILTFFIFIVFQYYFHIVLGLSYINTGLLSLLLALVSILFIVSLSKILSEKNIKYLRFIGNSSMAIYLMHIIAGSGIRIILLKFLKIKLFLFHFPIGLLLSIIIPLIVLALVNRYKIPFIFSMPLSRFIKSKLLNQPIFQKK
ncbi:MAG: acyltransferase [Candidatus Wallbacteria bacterium]